MGIMFGMFSFAFQVFSTQKGEVVIFSKFELACMHARLLGYLVVPYLSREHAPCMHMHDMHARLTRFTNNASHVTMMSLLM